MGRRRMPVSTITLVLTGAVVAMVAALFPAGSPVAPCLAGPDPLAQAECARRWADGLVGLERLSDENPSLAICLTGWVTFAVGLATWLAIPKAAAVGFRP